MSLSKESTDHIIFTLTHLFPLEYFLFSHKFPSLPFIVTPIGVHLAQYPKPFGLGSFPVKCPLVFLSQPLTHSYLPGFL